VVAIGFALTFHEKKTIKIGGSDDS